MTISYLKNFITDRNVASVTPTSKICVKRICNRIDFNKARVIVEFGPGGGCFTSHILKRMHPDAKLVAIDNNKDFFDKLKSNPKFQHPQLELVYDTVENAGKILEDLGLGKADAIVSGVPFAFFGDQLRRNIIKEARSILNDGANFLIYQFYPRITWKGEPLAYYLSEELHLTGQYLELPNIPPLLVYESIKVSEREKAAVAA